MMASELLNRALVICDIKPEELSQVTISRADSESGHLRQVYHHLEGTRRAPYDFMRVVSHYLVREYGFTDIAKAMLPDGFAIVPTNAAPNGHVDDELLAITEAEGEILKAIRRGDPVAVMAWADRIIREGMTLAAEGKAMR